MYVYCCQDFSKAQWLYLSTLSLILRDLAFSNNGYHNNDVRLVQNSNNGSSSNTFTRGNIARDGSRYFSIIRMNSWILQDSGYTQAYKSQSGRELTSKCQCDQLYYHLWYISLHIMHMACSNSSHILGRWSSTLDFTQISLCYVTV